MLRMDMANQFKNRSVQFLESKIKELQGNRLPFNQQMKRVLEAALQMKRSEEAAARAAVEAKARQEAERIARVTKIKNEIIALSAALAETRSALAEVLVKEKEEMDLLAQTLKQERITAEEINHLTEKCVELTKQIEFLLEKIKRILKDVNAYEAILKEMGVDSTPKTIAENDQSSSEISFQGNLSRGLVAYFPFNRQAIDETGQGHDGVINGAGLTKDRFGNANNAYHFDGKGYIKGSGNGFPVSDRTISLWIKPDIFQRNAKTDRGGSLFGYGGRSEQHGTSFLLMMNQLAPDVPPNNYETQGHYALNRLTFVDNAMYGSPSNWTHIALITKHDAGTKLYLNGNLVCSKKDLYISNTYSSGTDFGIGTLIDTSGHAPYADCNSQNFKGDIDEVRIYDRALSEEEIKALNQLQKKDSEKDCEKIRSYLTQLKTEIARLASTCNSPAANIVNEAAIEGLRKALAETKSLLVEASEREKVENARLEQEMRVEKNSNKELASLNESYYRLIEKENKLIDSIKTSFYGRASSPAFFSAAKNKTIEVANNNKNNVGFTP